MHWKVLTLTPDAFTGACRRLEQMISADGFMPDLVLSIRNGGAYVGNEMFRSVTHRDLLLQRGSTPSKSRMRAIIRLIPRPLQNLMRIAEARRLYRRYRRQHGRLETALSSSRRTVGIPLSSDDRFSNILIVDDAVDSGLTLRIVVNAVRRATPQAEIRTAVITATTPDPMIRPDYALYRDQTLIRFPWSIDA